MKLRNDFIRLPLLWLLLVLSLTAIAQDKREWKKGTLVSVTDSSSNRVIGNSPGTIQSVTDVEYRLSVNVDGMIYVGSYWPRWKWSYAPTDFIVNDPVDVLIDGKNMYIRRANGKELKTKIIQRLRHFEHPETSSAK